MIALHVEASFPDAEIWKEFAEVLILVFENGDEDRMSVCFNGSGEEGSQQTYSVRYNPIPRMFTDTSTSSWTLRAKWWLNRHFSPEILEAEMRNGTGDLEMMRLMSYKAACASRIYGPEFGYVKTLYGLLENSKNNTCMLENDSNNKNKLDSTLFSFSRSSQETNLNDTVFGPFTHIYVHKKQKGSPKFTDTCFLLFLQVSFFIYLLII